MTASGPTGIRIVGTGHSLGTEPVTSRDVETRIRIANGGVFSPPPGVLQRLTGIRRRLHVAADGVFASHLAAAAGRAAMADAGRGPDDVDLLVYASATRDMVEPATAHIVADMLDVRAPCFDLANACNSFLNGMQVAEALLASGQARTALVVTGETPSKAIRWDVDSLHGMWEHAAGYTFGDAGGAFVLEAAPGRAGIRHRQFESHSQHWEIGTLPGGGSRHPRSVEHTYFRGHGGDLKDAFAMVGDRIVKETFVATDTTWRDFAQVFVHQVTVPYLDAVVEATGCPRDLLDVTVADHGNLASATIPFQLDRARRNGRVGSGDQVLFIGLAGGMSLGTAVVTL